MPIDKNLLHELELLNFFDLNSMQGGIKLHKDAEDIKINAAQRLFDKGIISQIDGGYLTERGIQTAEHLTALLKVLKTE